MNTKTVIKTPFSSIERLAYELFYIDDEISNLNVQFLTSRCMSSRQKIIRKIEGLELLRSTVNREAARRAGYHHIG